MNSRMNYFLGLLFLVILFLTGQATTAGDQAHTVQVKVNSQVAIAANWDSEADNSTINLGSVEADNAQNAWVGGIYGEQLFSYSNVKIDVYTRASGNLTDGNKSIPLSNFLYQGGDVGIVTPFSMNYTRLIDDWDKVKLGIPDIVPINMYLTVPFGTEPGNYTTTIYFSAVAHNSPG